MFISKVDLRASGKFSFSVQFVLISRKPIPADLWQYSEDLVRWMQCAWEREICLIPLEAYEKEKPLPIDPPRYPHICRGRIRQKGESPCETIRIYENVYSDVCGARIFQAGEDVLTVHR